MPAPKGRHAGGKYNQTDVCNPSIELSKAGSTARALRLRSSPKVRAITVGPLPLRVPEGTLRIHTPCRPCSPEGQLPLLRPLPKEPPSPGLAPVSGLPKETLNQNVRRHARRTSVHHPNELPVSDFRPAISEEPRSGHRTRSSSRRNPPRPILVCPASPPLVIGDTESLRALGHPRVL